MAVHAPHHARDMTLVSHAPEQDLDLSPGEIHFLWHFIQGSIMVPETRAALHRAWGMCARHSFGFIAVEAAFRHEFLHGPAILYEDLMQRARAIVATRRPLSARWIAHRLRASGPCLMCDMAYGPRSRGYAPADVVEQGRDLSPIKTFAVATRRYWLETVCGRCAGDGTRPRCRVHLREDLVRGGALPVEQRATFEGITDHLRHYARAFRWEYRGTDSLEDRAALISAAGWCSGWGPWLALCAGKRLDP